MPYIGIPPFGQTVRTVTTITASASQTAFTPTGGYIVGYVDVYYNGVRLVDGDDYTATNGSTVTLTTAANAGDSVELVSYMPVSLADTYRQAEADSRFVNVTGDTMTGDLTLNKWNVPRKTWTSIATFGTTNKDWSLYSEWANTTDCVTIGNNTDSRNILNLYSSGYVTMPYQPAFLAGGTGGWVTVAANSSVPFNQLSGHGFDRGSNYNISTYRFTAPVAGVYFFHANVYAGQGSGSASFYWTKNGGYVYAGADAIVFYQSGGIGDHSLFNPTLTIQLNAGDWVDLRSRNTQSSNVYLPHSTFGGHLIG